MRPDGRRRSPPAGDLCRQQMHGLVGEGMQEDNWWGPGRQQAKRHGMPASTHLVALAGVASRGDVGHDPVQPLAAHRVRWVRRIRVRADERVQCPLAAALDARRGRGGGVRRRDEHAVFHPLAAKRHLELSAAGRRDAVDDSRDDARLLQGAPAQHIHMMSSAHEQGQQT